MNRYVVDGLLADMRQGKRVLYLAANLDQARDVLDQLQAELLPDEKGRRAHGMERVESPTGGFIKLQSVGSSGCGMSPDVVVIDAHLSIREWEDIAPLMVRAELVRL